MSVLTLPAGPVKRIWVNKHVLPQFGGTSPTAPAFFVESEGVRHKGCVVVPLYLSVFTFQPDEPPEGPHAWAQTQGPVLVVQFPET